LTENVDYYVWGKDSDWRLPGYLEAATHWTAGRRNYKVVYTAGYATIPEDLEEAALHACVWMKNKRKDTATKARTVGGDGRLEGFQASTELVRDLRAMLAPYIDHRVP